jgi:MFS family permease
MLDRTLVSVFFITLASNSAYAIMAPFLPFEFEKKSISQSLIGYIFAVYSLAVIVSSPIIGYLIAHIGRRPLIRLGVLLMGVSFLLFAAIDRSTNKFVYVSGALIARFL